jgi:hypothetical protein
MAYVMMAIPSELVPAVTAFIEGRPEPSVGPGAESPQDSAFIHGWDAETVRRAYRESADRMRGILDFLADNEDHEVSTGEIAEAIGAKFGWNTVAGMLGAFGRRSANRYGRGLPMWEFRNSDDDRTLLRMPAGPAEAIRSFRPDF